MKTNNGSYVNIDPDVLGYMWHGCKGDFSNLPEKIELYLEGYKGHGISDLLFNIFCQNSIVPTKHVGFIADKYNIKEEHGTAVDYSGETHTLAAYKAYEQMDDPIGYMMDKAKEQGYNVWLSYRMNDCHGSHAKNFCGRSENLYYYAKENGSFIGDHVAGSYFGECLDYSDKKIRDIMLAYVKETVERYDPYGIELDFSREMFCFDYEKTPDACEIMTGFIGDVKNILSDFEKRFGHKIKVLVRLVRDIENNRIFGFDVKEWIRLGLVDVLVPTSRWRSSDSDMPISEWKKLTEGTDVTVAAGIEFYLWEQIKINAEVQRALSAQYFDEGADKIYLYNQYREAVELPDMTEWFATHPSYASSEKRSTTAEEAAIWNSDLLAKIDLYKTDVWDASADATSARAGTRRHILTFTEDCLVPKGGTAFSPLPIRICGEVSFTKLTGNLIGEDVLLYIGITKDANPPRVTVDGNEASLIGRTDDAYFQNPDRDGPNPSYFTNFDYYAYKVIPGEGNYREIKFYSDSLAVEYLEFKVN